MKRAWGLGYSLIVLICALLLVYRGASADTGRLTVSRTSNGSLVATMTGESGLLLFDYSTSGCGPQLLDPCFYFHASNGDTEVPITAPGCRVSDGEADCPAGGVSSVTVAQQTAGSITTGGGTGHAVCSPVPVLVKAGREGTNIVVYDGCVETVDCGVTGFSTVSADRMDIVKANCKNVSRLP